MIIELLRALPAAIGVTVLLTTCALLFGGVLAVPIMLARVSHRPWSRALSRALVEFVRGVPPIVWLLIVFFGIKIGAFRFDAFTAGLVTLTVVASAYLSEIFRVGYLSVHKGQFESAAALGLSRRDALTTVVAPQAFRVSLPAMTTYGIALLKDSSIVSTIGLTEIVFVSTAIARVSADAITPFAIAAGLYLLLSVPLALLSRRFDEKLRGKVSAA